MVGNVEHPYKPSPNQTNPLHNLRIANPGNWVINVAACKIQNHNVSLLLNSFL